MRKSCFHAALLLLVLLPSGSTGFTFSWLASLPPWATATLAPNAVDREKNPIIPDHLRILILPGFGNDSLDYYLEQAPEGSLVASLRKRGWKPHQVTVLPVQRADWAQVFVRGALDGDFWKGTADPTRPAYRWYLDRVAQAVRDLTSHENDDDIKAEGKNGEERRTRPSSPSSSSTSHQVILVGHSAGGWLGRAACGFGSAAFWDDGSSAPAPSYAVDLSNVAGMVTLGSPHMPPPPPFMDMTRGALRITHETFPGAYHSDSLFYLTVAGAAVRGSRDEEGRRRRSLESYAYGSYEAVCGVGAEVGDGVVPLCSAHLDGATQLTLLDVYHSINAPDRWYGSDAVLDTWHTALLDALRSRSAVRTTQKAIGPFNLALGYVLAGR